MTHIAGLADRVPGVYLRLHPQARMTPDGLARGNRTAAVAPLTAAALVAGIPVADLLDDPTLWASCGTALQLGLLAWEVPALAVGKAFGQVRPAGWGPPRAGASLAGSAGHEWLVERCCGSGDARLSRFALLRAEGSVWLLESGRSDWIVELTGAGVAALAALERHPDLAALLRLADLGAGGDADLSAQAWHTHDRLFAQRSRRDSAALFSHHPAGDPLPARREHPPTGPQVGLPVPTSPGPDEPTLWQAQEDRCSVRQFAADPVGLDALGALLWRTLRVKHVRPRDRHEPTSYEAVFRPVASGGAMHASDLWLLCGTVAGLEPGAWWYDSFEHALVGVPGTAHQVEEQLARLGASSGGPAILGLLTVRHARTAWKYGPIAYALECKDIGVIMDALNLTAAAVGLGFCAWGSGPTRAVADLLELDPEVDVPMGEFVLGVAEQGAR